jgi:rhodanese-related sulfurtransferase
LPTLNHGVTVLQRLLILICISGLLALAQGLIIGPVDLSVEVDEWGVELSEISNWESILWVDARSHEAYEKMHHDRAIHLSEDDWDSGLGNLLMEWDMDTPIVVYCDGQHCANSREIAARLRTEIGEEKIYWLVGGWEVLQEVPNP